MPKVSKATAPKVEDAGIMEGRYGPLDGYTVGFEHFREDADAEIVEFSPTREYERTMAVVTENLAALQTA